MARGDITQKITLDGDAEVRRKLEEIGRTGEKAFGSLSRGAGGVDRPLQTVGRSSAQVGFAVRNLSFQVNDLVTSLAAGAPAMQVFAQQGGQIVQAFQQGGGLSAVLVGVTTRLKELITPMRALAGVGVAAAAGIAVVGARAISADTAVKQFKVTLDALRPPAFARGGDALKGLGISPEDLDAAAKRLRSVGLSLSEGRKEIREAIRAGIDPKLSEEVIKFGKDLDEAFGEKGKKSAEAFKTAIAGGPETLRAFGVSIGQINPNISELQDGLRTIPALLRKIMEAPNIKGAAVKVLDPITEQARDINVEFQNILDDITLFFKEGFVNAVSTGGAAANLLSAFGTAISEQNWAGIGNAISAAVFGPGVFTAAFVRLRSEFVAAWADTAILVAPFKTLADTIVQTLGGALSAESIWQGFVSAASAAVSSVMGLLASLVERANAAARALAAAFSSADRGVVAQTPIPFNFNSDDAGNFARGGLVRGPGTGTSDSIPAWLSNHEFVNTARAVQFWGVDFFRSLNRLQMPHFAMGGLADTMTRPIMPRSRSRLKAGAVSAAARAASGGRAVHLHIGNDVFKLNAEPPAAEALMAAARRKNMLSAGRKPGWVGGRRYGG